MNGKFFGKISTRLSGFFVISVFAVFLVLSAVAYAEEIIYTGDKNKLQEAPSWLSDEKYYFGLFPGTTAAPLSIGNKVTIDYAPNVSGATNPAFVLGGLSESEKTEGNRVTLLNGQVEDIIGGSSYYGDAVGNSVIISGGTVGSDVLGGFSNNDATGNMVTISGGYVDWSVYGGRSKFKRVAGNAIKASGGSVGWLYGGWSKDGDVTDNTVTIGGDFVAFDVYGGWSVDGDAKNNTVTISGGLIKGDVSGGYSRGGAEGNCVIISGGSVGGLVCGGWSDDGGVADNNVTISGGSVKGNVFGGRSRHGDIWGNKIVISGRPELTEAHLWGGQAEIEQEDTFTSNTLNFKSSGILAAGVGKFEYYNFYLPEELAAGAVMLSVADTVNLKGTIVAVFLQGGVKLKKGDKIALIHSAAGVSGSPKNKSCQVQQDGLLYQFSIYTDSNNLWAKVEKVAAPRNKAGDRQ